MRSPITIVIPVLLIVFTVITSFVTYRQNVDAAVNKVREVALKELKLDVTRLQNILYNLLSENKLADARVNLSVTAMNPDMQVLVLTDDTNKIIAANRYIWNSNFAKDVVDYDDIYAEEIKRTNKPQIFFDEKNNHLLKGYYPVVLKLESKRGNYRKQLGILFAEVNIKNKLLNAKNEVINNSVEFAGAMLLISLFIAILLNFIISRRLKLITQASEEIAQGNYETTVSISGNDEISDLAKSYNHMIEEVKDAFALREKSQHEIILLNEKLEERINERTMLLKQAQHIAKIGNWVWYVEENSLYWSDELYKICGVELGTFVLSYEGFIDIVHPDDIEIIEKAIEHAFNTNTNYKIEHRIILPNGEERWVREEGIPEIGNDGKRKKMTGIMQDITAQINDNKEKEKLEFELQQMQKMESLGQLTGGIAHDFNNMLAIIMGYNELSQIVALNNNDEKLIAYLDQVQLSSKRASELVQQMLAFSRVAEGSDKRENISIVALLSEISTMLKPLLSSSIILNVDSIEKDYVIYADSAMLNQTIMNLCLNAKDAMSEGQGHIDIAVDKVIYDSDLCSSCFNSVSGEYIEISIRDNGYGMSQEKLNRIFEPFFTTKEVGKGSGMGLAMVHGIMHKYNGHIIVSSKENYGTTFKLLFPVRDTGKEKTLKIDEQVQDLTVCEGNILVVDDEAAISQFLKDYLESRGYNVTTINDSKAALQYFIDNYKNIDLVITDFTMPGMNGIQLAEYMLTHYQDMPIILCSGYSEHINKEKALRLNIKDYLEKPINTALLLKAIKEHI